MDIIHYESWQYECCGTPFKVGDNIRWTAAKFNDKIWYEAHGEDEFIVEGKITEIVAIYRALEGDALNHKVVSERIENITDSESAFSDELLYPNSDDSSVNENLYCYVVMLENAKICSK